MNRRKIIGRLDDKGMWNIIICFWKNAHVTSGSADKDQCVRLGYRLTREIVGECVLFHVSEKSSRPV